MTHTIRDIFHKFMLTNLGLNPRLVNMEWIKRDLEKTLKSIDNFSGQPIKVLKGPSQAGKTILLMKKKIQSSLA